VKNYLIGGLICLVAALVFGFKPVQRVINEATNRGTVRGVETCMDYLKSELLSRDTVKTTCVQAFHNPLYIPELVMGQAGPRMDQGKVNWGVNRPGFPGSVLKSVYLARSMLVSDTVMH